MWLVMNKNLKIINILLIEDNAGDVKLIKRVFGKSKLLNSVLNIDDGEEAIEYLKKVNNNNAPDLILLDLNLPKVDGIEILKFIKNNHKTKKIPVVMLTTSNSEIDIVKSYNNYANSYVIKPIDFEGFVRIIKEIEGFYFNIVKLPPKDFN
jgi:CheY-like chemotaxis protein